MIKITITIKEVSENKVKENNTIKGKYIITDSNFDGAYILGVPCKVVSEPFMGSYKFNSVKERKRICIKVVSCITGISYTIPYNTGWFNVYNDYISVLTKSESFLHCGYVIHAHPELMYGIMGQVINKKYYPTDNSYSELLSTIGDHFVAGKEVKIISEPYNDTTLYDKKFPFVNVLKNDGSIVKCMFMEWKLVP